MHQIVCKPAAASPKRRGQGVPRSLAASLGSLVLLVAAWFILAGVGEASGSDDPSVAVNLRVVDENEHAVPRAQVEVRLQEQSIVSATTDDFGNASIAVPAPGRYLLRVSKKEHLANETSLFITSAATEAVEVVLPHIGLSKQETTVQGTSTDPVTEPSASASTLTPEQARQTPSRPATVKDALPLIPGVVRANDGSLGIAGYAESHSAMLVNSVDVTDPSTGGFGLGVPIDSVETINVSEMPYLAQYGKFIAGVVVAETRRGGDKWSLSLNDPLPEFRIRSGHLVGLRDMSPRLNFSGPLRTNRLYVSEGIEYLLHKQTVRTLPFPENETWFKAVNSFSQIDAVVSPQQTITASLHFSPHSLRYDGLDFFNPQPVTPNADFHESTATITHRLSLAGGLLESAIANTRVAAGIQPQGTAEMLLTPLGNGGNYFSQQARQATRFTWMENWMPRTRHFFGDHILQLGSVLSHSEDQGRLRLGPVLLQDGSGHRLQHIDFTDGRPFAVSDYGPAVYAQDHWMLDPKFALDLGVRLEEQTITLTSRTAPRAGFVWTPSQDKRTVLRGGVGVFYDFVPLGVYAFQSSPEQIVTTYDARGGVVGAPLHYANITEQSARSRFPFIDRGERSGNFAPYSFAWNFELEREISRSLTVRAKYLHSAAYDLITLQPQVVQGQNALVLGSSAESHTRQFEFTARVGHNPERQFFASYVRQHARGAVSDASSYTGNVPFPVVRRSFTSSLPYEIPNRFLLWGTFSLPRKFALNPHVELRNGFPYYPVNALQQYISASAHPQRFPGYFSADMLVAKDFQITKKHTVRISVPMINLTNHFNALEVHSNVADPLYRTFLGNYPRKILLDFDFLN